MASQPLLVEGTAAGTRDDATLAQPTTWRRLRAQFLHSGKAVGGVSVIAIVLVVVIAGPLLLPYHPNDQHFQWANAHPSFRHPFGGDELGRDVFTRALYGARISLSLALVVVPITAVVGTLLGSLSGFLGGFTEFVIMRTMDFMLVFPGMLLMLLLITVLGPGYKTLVIALSSLMWLSYARVTRAEALKLRELEFVQASRTSGSSNGRILLRHIFPNILHTVIVIATLEVSQVIITEASVSYLGLGIQPPTPTWGGMIAEGQNNLAQSPWILLGPAFLLTATVIAVNLLGDWLRDVLDPSLQIN